MLRLWALQSAISEPKPKSFQVSLMVRRDLVLPARPVKTKLKLLANQRAASENRKPKLKAVVVHFNRLISVRPLEASPNQIVLVGRSPAHIVHFGHT